ncbi:D-alanyl-D-alanine carboxypeptidase/D-alanyl-D-alanine-endopeptidase [Pararobbsia silviterrae]|uniref:D-alanyl-D-alanine carboxypeptidase/D-alanyl-D-alanine-endopeptidase n=1 Tax=Pararobbsia silviterrae TaxID=1792498 RepID=A0A494Y9W8_9BURK|nr:D-alanyl-D-alanine carboxypeptidase/D-alanyl-D-alanine-endopeptidase [Pararobbsia silviterrae]RKP59409.1 D-alanyl-D-alanine carboxypeptidase/D-alanyl-D-alanine-endopeptidase [Pararobbsia silviterrae]
MFFAFRPASCLPVRVARAAQPALPSAPRAMRRSLSSLLIATSALALMFGTPNDVHATSKYRRNGSGADNGRTYSHKRLRTTLPGAEQLPPKVAEALTHEHIPLSAISIYVEKIGATVPLIDLHGDAVMAPASTMKLVTTYSGLSMLGPDYRWKTTAYADGTVIGGVLHGNLYIKGTGDPKLVPEELVDLVNRIRAAGIIGLEGDLVLDKRYFDPSTRDAPPLDDAADAPYNVGPDPLLYAFKSLTFSMHPDDAAGQVGIDVLPPLAQLHVSNQLRLSRGPCLSAALTPDLTPNADGTVDATFSGDYSARCGDHVTNIAVLDHTAFFGGGFLALWQQNGGTFKGTVHEGPTPPGAHELGVHQSPPLGDIVHDINKFSNNVMARNLFLTIGAVEGKPPATTNESASIIRAWLAKNNIAIPDLVLDNGSGLSRDERITAVGMAELLQSANQSPVAQVFTDSLPIAGVDGTMRHRLANEPVVGNARIKTGTLSDVRAIAGYVASRNGNTYVVVSFINSPRAEAGRAAHDALLEWIYQSAQ